MYRTLTAVVLLALSGGFHGAWTHRWAEWSAPAVRASADRLERVPLRVGEWTGRRAETDPRTLPEEVIGRGLSIEYTNKDGTVVTVYLACGPTDGVVTHTPRVCYPANGYTCGPTDLRVTPLVVGDRAAEFWASNFTLPNPEVPVHLRVFWAWSDGTGWQIPNNPRRTFRSSPVLYKCYAIRQLVTPDEPLEGDPALQLLAALVPQLDDVFAPER